MHCLSRKNVKAIDYSMLCSVVSLSEVFGAVSSAQWQDNTASY